MTKLRLRHARSSVNKTQRYPLYAAIIVIVALCAALTVVLIQKNKLDSLQSTSLNEMAAAAQSDIRSASLECDKLGLPGADVKTIIHNIRVYLYAAKTMNESMINVYDFTLLDEAAYSAAQSATDGIEKQINAGHAYSEQLATLSDSMDKLEQAINSHYPEGENSILAGAGVK